MSTVDNVFTSARTYLNDDNAINWHDQDLMPKFQEAFRNLLLELQLNGIQLLQEVSVDMTVPTNTTDLTTVGTYPSDVISPIWLKEKLVGETDDFLISMNPCDFIPNVIQTTRLSYWSWRQNKVYLLGALNATVVQMRYRGTLAIPTLLTDTIGVTLGDTYLSYKTAAIAFGSAKDADGRDQMNAMAAAHLDKIIRYYVTYEKQMLTAKRKPYHGRGRSGLLL